MSLGRARPLVDRGNLATAAPLMKDELKLDNTQVSLLLAGFFFGFTTPNIFAIGQTPAGARAAGKWIGVHSCIGNIAGIVAPIITGVVVDRNGAFVWAFAIAAGVGLLGVVGWGLIVRRVEPVAWPAADALR